ncbi:uncharacterized protein LY89DRAFT_630856 [Mollisia scopiformis]|uniref:Rhodopsin domain-containing protein n=1 Tax=Mollisia scopiformis TaxID=149040 RepID=A0A132B5W8_MOLSC|nr:uncharacterized protein LY89DRAFT_630856 [Mollisia scopiformis]KUJ07800.1 hypothetical protein LY89DRAFT_630856 [Mollisia scopiformis]
MVNSSGSLPPDTNFAPGFVIPCGILAVIGVCLCVARIVTRLRPAPHLHLDDYLISIATFISVFEYVATCIGAANGWGHLSSYVPQHNQTIAFRCLFVAQLFWIFGTALVRISVAVSLLRLGRCTGGAERIWKWSLWSLIGVQILTSIGWLILLFFNCRPLRGMWEPVPELTCWPHKYTVNYGWVANPIIITIDFILAIMPVQLIRTLQRTLREKILISCLMATGLIATGIAAYKMTLSQQANMGDLLSSTVKLSLWCKLEEQVGIIAACLPCLKAQMEKVLHQIGILKKRFPDFALSLKQISISLSPSEVRRIFSADRTRANVDIGSVNSATSRDWASGTTTTTTTTDTSKSTIMSFETREVGRRDWDV